MKTISEFADEALATGDIAPLVEAQLRDNPFSRSLRALAEREAQLARTGTLGGVVRLTPEARRRCAIRGRAALMAAARLPDERARRLP